MGVVRVCGLPALAAALLLQGCAVPAGPRRPPTVLYVTPPPSPRPPATLAVKPPPRPRPPMLQQPLPPDVPGASAPPEPASASRPVDAPVAPAAPMRASVVGLSQDEVRLRLGAPDATTESGPSRTWTYRLDGCDLDIAFFYDVTRNGFFALSEHASTPGGASGCVARLAAAHAS